VQRLAGISGAKVAYVSGVVKQRFGSKLSNRICDVWNVSWISISTSKRLILNRK
jgi:hypothetical protein